MATSKNNPAALKPDPLINNQFNVETGSGGVLGSSC